MSCGRVPPSEFDGHKFQSVGKGEVDLGPKDEKATGEEARQETAGSYQARSGVACERLLADDVKEVRLSTRLVSSPACLVSEEKDFSPQLDELMRRMGHKTERTKRILEVNPKHELLIKLRSQVRSGPKAPELQNYARLFYGQALLAEGSPLPDGASYGRLISELMTKVL